MNNLEDITKPCTWKVMSKDKASTTFKDMAITKKLYDCVRCSGTPGSCPNYSDYYKLREKYGR